MQLLDQVRLVIYRVNQKGLEVFMINDGKEKWSFPEGQLSHLSPKDVAPKTTSISLDAVEDDAGSSIPTIAIEADWHEIPSIRSLIKQDVNLVKSELIKKVPELEKGSYFAVKECFKKVLPHEYKMVKELKDIIRDRNSVKYI